MSRRSRALLAGGLVAVMMLAAAGVARAAPAPPVTQIKSQQNEALLTFDTGLDAGFVYVTRSFANDGSVDKTYLDYLVVDELTGNFRYEGFGTIPNSSFTVTDDGARLLLDTRTVPDFTYSNGTGGLLDLKWTIDGTGLTHRDTWTVVGQEGQTRIITNQTATRETAPAKGTIFDVSISGVLDGNNEAYIGSYGSTTITIER